MVITADTIRTWLEEVKDPEIPVLSLSDMGIVRDVRFENNTAYVELTPTFVGCPAIDYMKRDVEQTLTKYGIAQYEVIVSLKSTWSSDLLTPKGREVLKQFGLAPPPVLNGLIPDIDLLEHAACPRCNGTNTELKSPFGPTLCRSLHYCLDCREAFEQFKPV